MHTIRPVKRGRRLYLRMADIQKTNSRLPLATDRLDLLRLFICTAETGKVSTAGEMLGLSQPSASRLLRRLEAMLDVRLLNRAAHGVSLTTSGQEFLIAARRLLNEWDRALEAAKIQQKTLSGHIRIAAPIAVGQSLLATIVARFIRLHPDITVDLELRDDHLSFSSSAYDLWIRAGGLDKDELVVREITYARRAVVAAADLPKVEHPEDLQTTNAVRLSTFVPPSIELRHIDGERFTLKQRCVFTTDNLYAAHEAVREGVGYAVLPLWAVFSDLDRGLLVHACPAWMPDPVVLSLAYSPDRKRPARVSALIRYLESELTRADGAASSFFGNVTDRGSVGLTSDSWFTHQRLSKGPSGVPKTR